MFDVALEHLGAADQAMKLAAINNLSVTDDLTTGQIMQLPDVEITSRMQRIIDFFIGTGEPPATEQPL